MPTAIVQRQGKHGRERLSASGKSWIFRLVRLCGGRDRLRVFYGLFVAQRPGPGVAGYARLQVTDHCIFKIGRAHV